MILFKLENLQKMGLYTWQLELLRTVMFRMLLRIVVVFTANQCHAVTIQGKAWGITVDCSDLYC